MGRLLIGPVGPCANIFPLQSSSAPRWKTRWAQPTDIESVAYFSAEHENILSEFLRDDGVTHKIQSARMCCGGD